MFVSRTKKKDFELSFQVWKVFMRMFNVYFSLRSNARKIIVKTLAISIEFLIILSFVFKIFGISEELGLILNIDFIPFQVYLILFQLISK